MFSHGERHVHLGRCLPVSAARIPDGGDHPHVLPCAGARVRRRVRSQHARIVLLSARRACDAGVAERTVGVRRVGLPYRGHVRAGGHAPAGVRRWRVAGHRVRGHVHAMAALLRVAAVGRGQLAAHRGHGHRAAHLLCAVPRAHRADGFPHTARVRALVRPLHRAFGARDARGPAYVRGRAAAASARVSAGGGRLLAQRAVRGVARVRQRRHPRHRASARGYRRWCCWCCGTA